MYIACCKKIYQKENYCMDKWNEHKSHDESYPSHIKNPRSCGNSDA